MNGRDRFLAACRCEPLDRPPVWIMRQAGRYLPEYRALKEKYSFKEMVETPELAREVTLQPLKRFPLDAAILFSDILVIPEALGQSYDFRETGGIEMAYSISTRDQVDALDSSGITEKLGYVAGALKLISESLAGEKALLGFGGSPWTLSTYMVEGGSSKDFSKLKALMKEDPETLMALLEKITEVTIDYFEMQVASGVDAIQIFDSWAAACPLEKYEAFSLSYIRRIVNHFKGRIPIILYAKGVTDRLPLLVESGVQVLSLDWTVDLADFKKEWGDKVCVQGNLNPDLLNGSPENVRIEALKLLDSMKGVGGHVFNLGHGIQPTATVENMEVLIKTVTEYK